MEEINDKLDYIILRLQDIERKLEGLESLKESSKNMDEHISFVENVYDSIKSPFYYILNKVSGIDIPEKKLTIKEV